MDAIKKLYLIPVDLGFSPEEGIYSKPQISIIHGIRHFITESASFTRKYLKKYGHPLHLNDIDILEFNEHNRNQAHTMLEVKKMLSSNQNIGLMSEAGMPCVADPGFEVVRMAHEMNIEVIPMHGPSSIMLALMASGMQGQRFIFHGYLPAKTEERKRKLIDINIKSRKDGFTHIFMEAPYRSNQIFNDIINVFDNNANVCVACEISTAEEFIKTKKVGQWKNALPDLHKKRCIFCVSA